MKTPNKIYLDVDDVLNRFTMSALRFLGCPVDLQDESTYDPTWGFDLQLAVHELLPGSVIQRESFWSRFPRSFWASIPISKECDSLLMTCANLVGRENVCLLTKPSGPGDCAAGKIDWINVWMPSWIRNQWLIGAPKHFCANKKSLLIDDSSDNVSEFERNHGRAILFPRPWNHNHGLHSLSYVVTKLEGIFRTKIVLP